MSVPLTSITAAVKVHITIVSIKTSAMLNSASSLGSFTQQEECTAADEPSPASLENAPLLSPSTTAEPKNPPAKAFGENAHRKMLFKAAKALWGRLRIIPRLPRIKTAAMNGTSFSHIFAVALLPETVIRVNKMRNRAVICTGIPKPLRADRAMEFA